MTDKYNSLKKTSESDRLVLTQQIKKFEDEMKHSLKVKETMAEEVVRLREVWADSQEQEAMWETKYNEILAITSQKDEEMEVLESSQEKERQSSANAIKHLEEEIRILNDDIEEMTARKRSDTVIGRLQGKVERIQEENAQLKEMTETMLSRDPNAAQASVLAFEIDSVSQEEIVDAYSTMQRDYAHLQKYVDKLLMNIIAEAPHLLCVDTSAP